MANVDGFELVRRAVAAKGWNGLAAAKHLNTDPAVVSRLLRGARKPSLDLAVACQKVLGVPVEVWPKTTVRAA